MADEEPTTRRWRCVLDPTCDHDGMICCGEPSRPCNDCGAAAGEPHGDGCDVARCMVTGQQRIQCGGQECPTCGHGDHEEPCGDKLTDPHIVDRSDCLA